MVAAVVLVAANLRLTLCVIKHIMDQRRTRKWY